MSAEDDFETVRDACFSRIEAANHQWLSALMHDMEAVIADITRETIVRCARKDAAERAPLIEAAAGVIEAAQIAILTHPGNPVP